jgi:hypothetical protein
MRFWIGSIRCPYLARTRSRSRKRLSSIAPVAPSVAPTLTSATVIQRPNTAPPTSVIAVPTGTEKPVRRAYAAA